MELRTGPSIGQPPQHRRLQQVERRPRPRRLRPVLGGQQRPRAGDADGGMRLRRHSVGNRRGQAPWLSSHNMGTADAAAAAP